MTKLSSMENQFPSNCELKQYHHYTDAVTEEGSSSDDSITKKAFDVVTSSPSVALENCNNDIESQRLASSLIEVNYKLAATKNGKETLKAVYFAGEYKAGLSFDFLIVQSFMAGIYISIASHLFLAVGGGIFGASLFPTGLIAVILTSAELFTGDAFVFVAAVLGQKVNIRKLFRNWTVSWTVNFIGAVFWAGIVAYASDSLQDLGRADLAIAVAFKKAKAPWLNIFLKGFAANLMVCLGIWQATCAEEVAGKILAVWWPIAGFVMMGFEHCIANQFFIPLGMMLGAEISVKEMMIALSASTLGNIVGGGFIAVAYWFVYDTVSDNNRLFSNIRHKMVLAKGMNKNQLG